jgi:hypothetical protein
VSRETSSDPLPFTQLDRTVKAKAAILAGAMGVTSQHAVGSLLVFWDLNGDPRELERLVEQGKDAVVLTGAQAALRFQIASGKETKPELLAEVGFLEPLGDDLYRVRGMSRYFKPIARRLQAKAAASLGGKTTSRKLKRESGRFVSETVQEAAGSPAGGAPEQPLQRNPAVTPSEPPSEHQANTSRETKRAPGLEDRDQRSEVISSKEEEPPSSPKEVRPVPLPAKPPDPFADAHAFWAEWQNARHQAGYVTEKPPPGLSGWFSEMMLELNGDKPRVEATMRAFSRSDYWRARNLPIHALMRQWREFVPRKAGA